MVHTLTLNCICQQAATQTERATLSEKLSSAEDWLYMEGDGETAREFAKRRVDLEAAAAPMMVRAAELEARPSIMAQSFERLEKIQKLATSWAEKKPWINESDQQNALEKVGFIRLLMEFRSQSIFSRPKSSYPQM